MVSYTCSIKGRSGDLAGQGNMSILCRALCVITGVSSVSKPQTVWLQAFPWPTSEQHTAITGIKAEPAFIRKHNRSPLRLPMNSHLAPLASQSIMAWSQCNAHCRAPGLEERQFFAELASIEERARCVLWFHETKSPINAQCKCRRCYGSKTAAVKSRKRCCQVIYSQFGLAIHQNDQQARRRFFEWTQNDIAVVPDFHKQILFSYETHFWLNGYVNKQNCRIWSEANPQVYVETPLHPEKLTVWIALWAGGILLQKR
ncbi:putative transposable element [Trichonephila clavipes]|nr:putative transposable element [Trichonephila clavipes]